MASSLIVVFFLTLTTISWQSQAQSQAPPPTSNSCNGIYLSYTSTGGSKIPPNLRSDPTHQPYRFQSTLLVLNNGLQELKSWRAFVGFQHDELLVSASNAVLSDGTSLPGRVGNGTVFAGYPATDLKTAVDTAGDVTQMSASVDLVGTQFGVAPPGVPMPSNISLANGGWICPTPTMLGNATMQVCCARDSRANSTVPLSDEFLPRQNGDLTMMYDVIRTYDTNYWAQVSISIHNPLGRLDNWNLTWDWMNGEFIFSMRGAYPFIRDSSECVFGEQGQYYQGMDFSNVMNCDRSPTIIDLPQTKENDTNLGFFPFCCRGGTILPPTMDPSRSSTAFQMNVYKMPPNLNRSILLPPQNWKINGSLNPDYVCGSPVRVDPSLFPDPNGVPDVGSAAIASWQVVCNITETKSITPRCCVSFSAFYNDSVIPCPTCACGCPTDPSRTCSTTSPALFLPPQALLVPFDNRTALATAWAGIKRRPVPSPLPCGDNCGVSINWHLFTDYSGGWSARITLFNWDETAFPDWFVAVEMDKAAPGFQKIYSFNGSTLGGNLINTIFMQGLPGLNYLAGEVNGSNPQKDPPVPGKQQSVISFTKKKTPGINVVSGDGFPSRVIFNGEECALPSMLPMSGSGRLPGPGLAISVILALVVLVWMQR